MRVSYISVSGSQFSFLLFLIYWLFQKQKQECNGGRDAVCRCGVAVLRRVGCGSAGADGREGGREDMLVKCWGACM